MKLIIRNLDRLTTEEELKDLFQEFGAVERGVEQNLRK